MAEAFQQSASDQGDRAGVRVSHARRLFVDRQLGDDRGEALPASDRCRFRPRCKMRCTSAAKSTVARSRAKLAPLCGIDGRSTDVRRWKPGGTRARNGANWGISRGGTRTRKPRTGRGILNPLCIPFHHAASKHHGGSPRLFTAHSKGVHPWCHPSFRVRTVPQGTEDSLRAKRRKPRRKSEGVRLLPRHVDRLIAHGLRKGRDVPCIAQVAPPASSARSRRRRSRARVRAPAVPDNLLRWPRSGSNIHADGRPPLARSSPGC